MLDEWSRFWWKNITGAHYIVEQVAETLLSNKTAILNVPYDLPWRHDMRAEVELTYRPNAELNVVVDQVDDLDERTEEQSVGMYLLNKYGQKSEIINNYRERGGKTLQEYLIENEVLRNRIIWVKGLSQARSKEWISFVDGFRAKSSKDGLFVLEIPGDLGQVTQKNVNIIKYSDYVTENDVQLLNSFMLSETQKLSEEWKQYISILSAKLCGTDAEASEWLIRNIDFTKMTPIDALGRLSLNENFVMRGSDDTTGHALALYRCGDRKSLEDRVWSAQVRIIFPLIEFETHSIIESYYNDIKESLENNEYKINDRIITDPFDLDISGLNFLVKSGGVYISDYDLRKRIDFLRISRNNIAHHDCCAPDVINKLITER